jgi:hypothetical protein
MSGVGFLATMKTFAPSIRRRRRIDDKKPLELRNSSNPGPSSSSSSSTTADENLVSHEVPPITPPAAFLPPGYKRLSMKGKLAVSKGHCSFGDAWPRQMNGLFLGAPLYSQLLLMLCIYVLCYVCVMQNRTEKLLVLIFGYTDGFCSMLYILSLILLFRFLRLHKKVQSEGFVEGLMTVAIRKASI